MIIVLYILSTLISWIALEIVFDYPLTKERDWSVAWYPIAMALIPASVAFCLPVLIIWACVGGLSNQ